MYPVLQSQIPQSLILMELNLTNSALKQWQECFPKGLLINVLVVFLLKPLFYLTLDNWENRRRPWHPTPVLLPGESHGRRSLVGYSPWGREESDTTEWLHFHFSLSCIGEGNGNPLQCSCLEIPRDGGAWWAAVYGVAQSRTRLKWLSSSSNWESNPRRTVAEWLGNVMLIIFQDKRLLKWVR